jgi:hypothetical protein
VKGMVSPKAIYRGVATVNDDNNFTQVPLVKDVILQLVDIKSSAKDDFIPAILKFSLELASNSVSSVPEFTPPVLNRAESQRSGKLVLNSKKPDEEEEEESEEESDGSSDSSSLFPPPLPSTLSPAANSVASKKPSLEKLASFHEFLQSGLVDEDDSNQEEESESEESEDSIMFPVKESKGNEDLQPKVSLDKSKMLNQFLRQGSIDEDNSLGSENDDVEDDSIDDDSLEKEIKSKSVNSNLVPPASLVDESTMLQSFIREGSMDEENSESAGDSVSVDEKTEDSIMMKKNSIIENPAAHEDNDMGNDRDSADNKMEEESAEGFVSSTEVPFQLSNEKQREESWHIPVSSTIDNHFEAIDGQEEEENVNVNPLLANKEESDEEVEQSLPESEDRSVNKSENEEIISIAFDKSVVEERRGSVFDMADIYNTDIALHSEMFADDIVDTIKPNEKLFEMSNPLLSVESESSVSSDEGDEKEDLLSYGTIANTEETIKPGSDANPSLMHELESNNDDVNVIEEDKERKHSSPLSVENNNMSDLQSDVSKVYNPFFVMDEDEDEDEDENEDHQSEVETYPTVENQVTAHEEVPFFDHGFVAPVQSTECGPSVLQSKTDESLIDKQVKQQQNDNLVEANPFFHMDESEKEDEETDDINEEPHFKSGEIDEVVSQAQKDYEENEQETILQSSVVKDNDTTNPFLAVDDSCDETDDSIPVSAEVNEDISNTVHNQGTPADESLLLLGNDDNTTDGGKMNLLLKAEGHLTLVENTEDELSLGAVSSELEEEMNPFLVLSDDTSDQELISVGIDTLVDEKRGSALDLSKDNTKDTVLADDILETLNSDEQLYEMPNPLLSAVNESPVPSVVSSEEEESNEPEIPFQPPTIEQKRSSLALLFSESFLLPFEETIPSTVPPEEYGNDERYDDDSDVSVEESVEVYCDEDEKIHVPQSSMSDPLFQHVQDLSMKVQLLLEENERQKEALRALQQGTSKREDEEEMSDREVKSVRFAMDTVSDQRSEEESFNNQLESPKRRSKSKASLSLASTSPRRSSNISQNSRQSLSSSGKELQNITDESRQAVEKKPLVQQEDNSHVHTMRSTFIDLSKPTSSLVERFFNNVKAHQEEEEAEGLHHYEDEEEHPKRRIHLGSAIATPIRLMTRRRGIYDQNASSILSNIIAPVNISPDSSRNATPVALTSSHPSFFPIAQSSNEISDENSFIPSPSSQPRQFDLNQIMSRRNEMMKVSSVADVKPMETQNQQIQQQLQLPEKTLEIDYTLPSSVIPMNNLDSFSTLPPPAALTSSNVAPLSSSTVPSIPKVNKLKKFDTSALQNMFAKRGGGDEEETQPTTTIPIPENFTFPAIPTQQAPLIPKSPLPVAVKEKKPMNVFYSELFTLLLDGIRPGMVKAVSLLESSITSYNSTVSANDKPRWNTNISGAGVDGNRRRSSVVASTSSNNLMASASNDASILVNPTPVLASSTRRSSLSIDSNDMTTFQQQQQQRNNSTSPNTIASTSGRRSSSVFQSRRGSSALSSSSSFPILPSSYDDLISFFALISDYNRIDDLTFQNKMQLSFSQNLKINDLTSLIKHVLLLSEAFHDWKKNNDPSSRYHSGEVNWEISDLFHSTRVLVSLFYYSNENVLTSSSLSSFPSKQLPFSPSKSFDGNDSFKSIEILRKLNALQDSLVKFLPIVSKNSYAPSKSSLSSQVSSLLQSCEVLLAQFCIFSSLKNLALMEIMLRLAVLQESLLRQRIFFKSIGNRDLAKYCKKLGNAVSIQLQLEKELLDLRSHEGVAIPGSPVIRSPPHDPSPPSGDDKLKSTVMNLFPDSPPSSSSSTRPKKRPSSIFYSEIAKHLQTSSALLGDGKYCLEKIRWIILKADEVYHRYCLYKETVQTVTLLDAHDDSSSSSSDGNDSGDSDDESFSESKKEMSKPIRRHSQSRSPFSASSSSSRKGKGQMSMASLGKEIQFFASKVHDHKFQKSREKQKEYRLETVIEELLSFKEEMNKLIIQLTSIISIEETDEFILSLSSNNPASLSNQCYDMIYQGNKEKEIPSSERSFPTLLIQLQSKKLLHSIYETWPSLTFRLPMEKPVADMTMDSSGIIDTLPSPLSSNKKKSGQNVSFSTSISSSSSTVKSEASISVLRTALRTKSYKHHPNEETKQQLYPVLQKLNAKPRSQLSLSSSTHSVVSLPSPAFLPSSADSTFTLSMLSPSTPGAVSTFSDNPQNVLSSTEDPLHSSSFLPALNEESLETVSSKHIDLSSLDFTNTKTLRKVGFSLCQLRDSGCYSWNSLLFAGFPLNELKHLRLLDATSFELVMSELRKAGYSIEQCYRAGFGLKALKVAGYTEMELIECGLFSSKQLSSIGLDIQRFVLKVFYESLDGKYWKRNDNWLSPLPLSSWYGLKLDANRNIISIDLRSNHLTGNLPECLSFLSFLQYLDLYNNDIVGTVPPSYARLSKLRDLWLDGNPELGRTMTKPQLQKLLPNCRVRI